MRLYTRNVPAPVAERRIGEIDADLHDHIAHERASGTGERRIALGVLSRMVRGVPADASWRGRHTKEVMRISPAQRSVVRVALVTAVILLVPLLTMLFSDGEGWSVGDFVFAAVLLGGTGLLLEMAARKPRSIIFRIAAAGIGVAAIVFGEADDAPGLVLFGLVFIVGAVALTLRTARAPGD